MNTTMSPDAAAAQAEFLTLYQAMDAFAQERIFTIARSFTVAFPAPKRAPRLALVHSAASTTSKKKQVPR
jgi:hypothetical protein